MPFPATTLLLSIKIILISVGAISIAMAIKFSVPSVVAFTFYELPMVWTALLTWLRPPYLYFVINGIIITIAASSRFNHHRVNNSVPLISSRTPPQSDVVASAALAEREAELDRNAVEAPPTTEAAPVLEVYEVEAEDEERSEVDVVELKPVVVNGVLQFKDAEDDVANDDWMIAESSFTPPERIPSPESSTQVDLLLPAKEKPLPSSRLGHRKPIKTGLEGGRARRAARPKAQEETLESMWKKITEDRHLKKPDTWETYGRQVVVNPRDHDDLAPKHVLKSATFRERTNYDVLPLPPANLSPVPGKIKQELSLSQDELNRRVEAFIKKFNEDMRLQRQESLNRYKEMINRGAY